MPIAATPKLAQNIGILTARILADNTTIAS
jgi:hypothetical protein